MFEHEQTTALAPISPQKLNKTINQSVAVRENRKYQADYVPHIDLNQIRQMIETTPRDRDRLIIKVIFDACLRCHEALAIRPCDIIQSAYGWQLTINVAKGNKKSSVAISAGLVAQLQAYAYRTQLKPDERFFPIQRTRVFQIVQQSMRQAGVSKPDGVGAVHVLRHSGALERLRRTQNPKAVQDQLRHKSAQMTLRYLKTLSHEESIQIQQGVDFSW